MDEDTTIEMPMDEPTEPEIPPKLDLSKNGISKEPAKADPKSETIHIKMPSDLESETEKPKLVIKPDSPTKTAIRVKPPSEQQPAADPTGKKKETSRIPLDEAAAIPGQGIGKRTQAPKTIRIKPITKKTQVAPPIAKAPAPKSETASLDEKRKTSRISLDSVFRPDTEAAPKAAPAPAATPAAATSPEAAPERPKTIRLKRPSEAATIKLAQRPKPATAPKPHTGPSEAKTVLSKTSRIDEEAAAEEEGGISPTRRKTIRVKRPTEQAGVRGLSIKRADEEEEEPAEQLGKTCPTRSSPSWPSPRSSSYA